MVAGCNFDSYNMLVIEVSAFDATWADLTERSSPSFLTLLHHWVFHLCGGFVEKLTFKPPSFCDTKNPDIMMR
jgi:hypothetical protein